MVRVSPRRGRLSKLAVWCVALGLVVGTPLPVEAQTYRDDLAINVSQLEESLVAYAQRGDYARLEKALILAAPLLSGLHAKTGTDLEGPLRAAMARSDAAAVGIGVARILIFDMSDQLALGLDVVASDRRAAHLRLRAANQVYQILSAIVKERNASADETIKGLFQEGLVILYNVMPTKEQDRHATAAYFQSLASKIRDQINFAFPEFK